MRGGQLAAAGALVLAAGAAMAPGLAPAQTRADTKVQAPAPPPALDLAALATREAAIVRRAEHEGRAVFDRQCAPCHAAGPGDDGAIMLPGTMALALRHRGGLPAALELRRDLEAAVLGYFVRQGSGAMPMFRKAELSDAEIAAIAGYLRATAQRSGT